MDNGDCVESGAVIKNSMEKPVTQFTLVDDGFQVILIGKTGSGSGDKEPGSGEEDDETSVNQGQTGQHRKDDEPEPEEDVDFLVDDVDGQDTHGIVTLHITGGTISVEGTFGKTWEDFNHRIVPHRPIPIGELKHFGSVRRELSAKECVHKEDLTNDVHEIHHFGQHEPEKVHAVIVEIGCHVLHEKFSIGSFGFLRQNGRVETQDQILDAATFHCFPEISWDIE
ncbi:hypothetical protein TNIN_436471 [Trichonephila inaurata madagascariensis]|uniref:Uncharacterized protein n=1 Tax=Trichonephila inaurata madagascariensis TaxID=2747483 RepID=A0A8X6Y4U9_9ARAC|nr:hypothetical protein TNIN_436471 [Trichonephila inaurata madagascariensis]